MYKGTSKFKKGYQPRGNLVRYEKGDVLAATVCRTGARMTSVSY